MKPVLPITLADAELERVRRNLAEVIGELQAAPAAGLRVIEGITLADGVPTAIPHGLARAPRWVRESCVRGALTSGRVEELRDRGDRRRAVTLRATGYGATITIDLAVIP